MNTPILFITFNRPDTTNAVFDVIRAVKPKRLIISSDGPRENVPDDVDKVMACRSLFTDENIDWDCNITRLYNESNKGCALGVSEAISQAFELEEKLIILEDDVVPDPSFFSFCTKMLHKYENNQNVMHISGTRWNPEFSVNDEDHFFSTIGHIWGWATWRRSWKKYDYELVGLDQLRAEDKIFQLFKDRKISDFWLKHFEMMKGPSKKTWDYQWQFTLFYSSGLAVVPNVNMISNIGTDGVHYQGEPTEHHYQPLEKWHDKNSFPIIQPNKDFERYHMRDRFMKKDPLMIRILRRIGLKSNN